MKKIIFLNLVVFLIVSGCTAKLYDGPTLPDSKIVIINFNKPRPLAFGVGSIDRRDKVETIFGTKRLYSYTRFKIRPGLTSITITIPQRGFTFFSSRLFCYLGPFLTKPGHVYHIYWEEDYQSKGGYSVSVRMWVYDETSNKKVSGSECNN